jgi:hypothetical protein
MMHEGIDIFIALTESAGIYLENMESRLVKMTVSISKPELLTITDSLEQKSYFGADQEWYEKSWGKKAGCGPTCASNITAYLAQTRDCYKPLFMPFSMERKDFVLHMEELFRYITPGVMGVNHVDMFTEGLIRFAKDRGIDLKTKVFSIEEPSREQRFPDKLKSFVLEGLEADCPLAFLNLSPGRESNIQPWHWITITGADFRENGLTATASDEGKAIQFDLLKWYLTTDKHGGLIYVVA